MKKYILIPLLLVTVLLTGHGMALAQTPAPSPDAAAPTVTNFVVQNSVTLKATISSFTATDAVGVTGYLVSESSAVPAVNAPTWKAIATTSYTFTTYGPKTLYAWAKDAAGNISASKSASFLVDNSAPIIYTFTLPATYTSLTVPILVLDAVDNYGITGYLLSESASQPLVTDPAWTVAAPTSYTFDSVGSKTLYVWAKDAVGLMRSNSSTVVISSGTPTPTPTGGSDVTAPVVSTFTIPATSASYVVPITAFTATDAGGVAAYVVTESSTAPAYNMLGWLGSAPASYTFSAQGNRTLYAWAKDNSNNVSLAKSATVNITIPQPQIPITGWAWSSNIGWISFSSDNSTALGGGPYGVYISTSTANPKKGDIKGYAWSSNIGWIKFGDLGSFPAASINPVNAYIDLDPTSANLGKVYGFARACAGTVNGDCSSMLSRTDGWDGWIELSGTNHPSERTFLTPQPTPTATPANVGVSLNTTTGIFKGYAWGSDVVGWVTFQPTVSLGGGGGGNNPHVPSCQELGTCPTTNTSIYAECTGSLDEASGIITWSAFHQTGGSGAYKYKWAGSAVWTNTSTYSLTPSSNDGSPQVGPALIVSDANNAALTWTPYCPNVNAKFVISSSNLLLKIGPNNGIALVHNISSPLKIKLGSKFKLEWTNTLPMKTDLNDEGYRCASIIDPDKNITWKNAWTNVSSSGTLTGLDTTTTGSYKFTIDCTYVPDSPAKATSTSAYLRIYTISENEI